MKVIPTVERQLVRRAACERDNVQVVKLIGRAGGGRVDNALAVDGNLRPGAIQRLLLQDADRLADTARFGRHAPQIARAEAGIAIAHEHDLRAIGSPGRLRVAIPETHVEALAGMAVIEGQGDGLAVPMPVAKLAQVDVEVAAGESRDVGQAAAVRGEDRIQIDLAVAGELARLAGAEIENLEADAFRVIVGSVHDPFAVGRNGRRRVIARIVGQLGRVAGQRVDLPDGALHGDSDRFAIREPRRRPGGGAGSGRQIVVLHVLPALPRGRIHERVAVLLRARGERAQEN